MPSWRCRPTSTPRRSSMRRRTPMPTRCTPDTGSSPRTRHSRSSCWRRGSAGSARPPTRCAASATRPSRGRSRGRRTCRSCPASTPTACPTRPSSGKPRCSGRPCWSRQPVAAAVAACGASTTSRPSARCWPRPGRNRWPGSARSGCSWNDGSKVSATSRCRCCSTTMGTRCISASATARCNDVIRRSWKLRPLRVSTTSCEGRSGRPRSRSPEPAGTGAPARPSSCSPPTGSGGSSR